jgi:ADP-heptose:LPS heptosyltransferase
MSNTSETGHAKNAAKFDELTSFAAGYGRHYNPSKTSIQLSALQTLSTNAKNVVSAVSIAEPTYKNAVAARETAFAPLSKLITRVMNALKATDTTEAVDNSAKTLVRKIQGVRASTKKTEEEKKALAAEGKEVVEISASQMSYDSRLDNFDKLIKLLISITLYAPNEADLKVVALTTLCDDLKAKNSAVVSAATILSNARIARNEILYKPDTGLVDIALAVKTYIKSLYGATSPQYKQVSKLEFRAVKV